MTPDISPTQTTKRALLLFRLQIFCRRHTTPNPMAIGKSRPSPVIQLSRYPAIPSSHGAWHDVKSNCMIPACTGLSSKKPHPHHVVNGVEPRAMSRRNLRNMRNVAPPATAPPATERGPQGRYVITFKRSNVPSSCSPFVPFTIHHSPFTLCRPWCPSCPWCPSW